MKLRKTFSILIASWVVLSSGFHPVVNAENLVGPTEITLTAQTEAQEDQPQQNIEPTAVTPPVETATDATPQEATLTNTIEVSSLSGSVDTANNTEIESISSGETTVVATVINIDGQSADGLDQSIETYEIAPPLINSADIILSLGTDDVSANIEKPITIPLYPDQEIVKNTITLTSAIGDITASKNTNIGQLGSGDAYANANVINILGSNVSAPEIFLGYMTVRGSLTGDILLSDALLTDVFGSSGNHPSEKTTTKSNLSYDVSNNINANSASGNASVTENGIVGNIDSGRANNLLTIHDLVGLDVFGQTGLLIFISVTGEWDGSIASQDKGVNSALIGVSGTSGPVLIPLSHQRQTLLSLNNAINITSQSGDVSAYKNSSIGDVKTGDATTVINIANIIGSSLRFTKSFGILFITILGDWYGSFGVDTQYGGQKSLLVNEVVKTDTQPTYEPSYKQETSEIFLTINTNVKPEEFDKNTFSMINSKQYTKDYPGEYEEYSLSEQNDRSSDIAWIIPFIGGSIAIGLLQANKKTRMRLK